MEIITKSDKETKKLGEKLAREILKSFYAKASKDKLKTATVLSLEGDLGAGKTTFTQGFAKGLGIKEKIKSPTFVIMKIYAVEGSLPAGQAGPTFFKNFIHVDAYRLRTVDFTVLNWKDFVRNPKNLILVEWGNKIKNILPKGSITISFGHTRLPARQAGHVSNRRLIKIHI